MPADRPTRQARLPLPGREILRPPRSRSRNYRRKSHRPDVQSNGKSRIPKKNAQDRKKPVSAPYKQRESPYFFTKILGFRLVRYGNPRIMIIEMEEKAETKRKAKAMSKRNKIKKWVVDAMVDAVKAGQMKIEDITEDRLQKKVRAAMKAESTEPATVTLTGVIKRESDKAVFFAPTTADANEHSLDSTWWPKSQIEIFERAIGPCDQIEVPAWLLAKKNA